MARETLSDELKEAGYRLLFVTDLLKMRAQGAMWIYRHELNDWRYYLVTSLVDAVGRRETYKMIARIFSAPGADGFFSKEFTLEDVHLGSPSDEFFKLISSIATVSAFGLLEKTRQNLRIVRLTELPWIVLCIERYQQYQLPITNQTRSKKNSIETWKRPKKMASLPKCPSEDFRHNNAHGREASASITAYSRRSKRDRSRKSLDSGVARAEPRNDEARSSVTSPRPGRPGACRRRGRRAG
jgi:hypothetical protein